MRALALAFVLAACSGAALNGGPWRVGDAELRMSHVPDAWHRIDTEGGSVGFRDEANDASVLVNARCKVASDDVPLAALTNHLVMGTTARDYVTEETISMDGREALHTVLRAKLDGVPMTYDVYVLKKNGCVYDFVYVAAPSRFAAGAPAFERWVSGFRSVAP